MKAVGSLLSYVGTMVNDKTPTSTVKHFYELSAKNVKGQEVSMKTYENKVVLVINIASLCGLTKSNYSQLAQLAENYQEKGLEILLFPCNQFAAQEPGTEDEIDKFACEYSPRFKMFSKVDVNGANTHPIYAFLRQKVSNGEMIKWNFTKFLIDRKGEVIKRFGSNDEPNTMIPDIEKLL